MVFLFCSSQQCLVSDSSLPTHKRSPTRRKSRWEPIADEKLGEKLTSVDSHSAIDARWGQVEAAEKKVTYLSIYLVEVELFCQISFFFAQVLFLFLEIWTFLKMWCVATTSLCVLVMCLVMSN